MGPNQQFRTHGLEWLVNRPREGCSRIAGTVGRMPTTARRRKATEAHPFAVDECDLAKLCIHSRVCGHPWITLRTVAMLST
jgi:hypothetical protein